jgi:O-antigen/teichoic acid export membrane protein
MLVMDRKKIISASLWVIAIFGLSQLLRLGSNLVVTRLLEPEMFGLMAIVYVVMHGTEMFSDLGFWAFIVRHEQGTETRLLDTVWTMQVIRGWLIFMTVIVMAVALIVVSQVLKIDLGNIYGDDRLPFLLVIIGFTAVIRGYKTMAPAIVSRELKRGRLECIELIAQICGAVVMLVWAWKQPSVWALVSAGIIASIINIILIYKLFDYRHNISWNRDVVNEVFMFGKWIFLASALTYIAQQGDRLIFASYISAEKLGIYSIAFMLTGVITSMLDQLNYKICFPVFSKVVNSTPNALKEKYYFIRFRQDLVVFLVIGFLIATAPRIIKFLYDERYHSAGWMMQILLFSVIGLSLSKLGLECLSALGITKIRMKVMFFRALSIFIALPVMFYYYGFLGALWGVVLGGFSGIPVQYLEMKKQNVFSLFLEVRLLPMVVVGYAIGYFLCDYNRIMFSIISIIENYKFSWG